MSNLIDLSGVAPSTVQVGDRGTLWDNLRQCGQGGTVTAITNVDDVLVIEITGPLGNGSTFKDPACFVPEGAEAEQERYRLKAWDDWENDNGREHEFPNEAAEMAYSIGWSNAVRYGNRSRDSISRYADSDVEPSWLDEGFAGERWGDDY